MRKLPQGRNRCRTHDSIDVENQLNLIEALALGVIQGLTEFLPVSSSGHLVLAQEFLMVNPPGVIVEIVLHIGTLCSIMVFYKMDLIDLLVGTFKGSADELQTVGQIALATLPAVIGGLLLKDHLKMFFSGSFYTGIFLCMTGCILFLLKFREPNDNPIHYRTSIMIGVAQMIAILPGISRSGMTITAAILLGISGSVAFRFSFLLAIPVIVGAGILSISDVQQLNSQLLLPLFFGCAAAAVTGYAALKLLYSLVIKHKMWQFSIYCWTIGIIGIYFGV